MKKIDIANRFSTSIPLVVAWIDTLLARHQDRAVSVDSLRFARLGHIFPQSVLDRTKVVVVSDRVPFPPLIDLGLPEFQQIENMPIAGMTYRDTLFLNEPHSTESLYFHELVHVIQWETLGDHKFLLAYGMGLMQFGYHGSPLEKMAYALQSAFEQDTLPTNFIDQIRQDADCIWNDVASIVSD